MNCKSGHRETALDISHQNDAIWCAFLIVLSVLYGHDGCKSWTLALSAHYSVPRQIEAQQRALYTVRNAGIGPSEAVALTFSPPGLFKQFANYADELLA